jgi:uncharacterized damage-inducible protein DinB
MKRSTYHSEIILGMNDRLFINALAGVTDEQAADRISEHNNPLVWIATHTVWARYNIAQFLGKAGENPYAGMFENFKAYDPAMQFDSVEKIKENWQKATALVKEAFEAVTEEHLAADSPIKSPIGDFTNGGTIAFMAQHESYDIGQMAFLKKYLTSEAMSYS